jgi:hypothetical protein
MNMPPSEKVNDATLKAIRDQLGKDGSKVRAWQVKDILKSIHKIDMDESSIRGRFIEMGEPLSGMVGDPKKVEVGAEIATTPKLELPKKVHQVTPELTPYIPREEDFTNYIVRDIDKRLETHLNASRPGHWKYPICQGKQGTGKTYGYMYYAWNYKLPFFLYSMYEDFKLTRLFGDKTIINGSIVFQESLFVKAIQGPSMVLFDEINALSNANTFDFHALLQNRELFIKDANNGLGKVFQLHDDCKIGFAQNPKSAKYIGGNIKASNFLGRCTYLTYPEFSKKEIRLALKKKFPTLVKDDLEKFVAFYFACIDTIDKASVPVDVSIRQLNNMVDLWLAGMPIKFAIEDGLTSIMESISQPKAKETFFRLAQAVWKELLPESAKEKVKGKDEDDALYTQ